MSKKRGGKKKSRSSEVEKTITISHCAIAFIDLLSQKDVLRKINKLPENEDEEREFLSLWRRSVGVVRDFRRAFDAFYGSFLYYEPPKPPKGVEVPKETVELMRRFVKCEIKKQSFSDSMIYYVSMAETPDRFPITGIHGLLSGCAGIFLSALSLGFICRGAIEAGIAGEFFKGEVYGPALYHAYRLESEIAHYPRIVVGSALIDYIKNETLRPIEHEGGELIRRMAKRCLDMFCVDMDGVTILDYAGAEAREMFPTLQGLFQSAIDFATSEWRRFQKEGDHKLAGRYFMLIHYLTSRRRIWS